MCGQGSTRSSSSKWITIHGRRTVVGEQQLEGGVVAAREAEHPVGLQERTAASGPSVATRARHRSAIGRKASHPEFRRDSCYHCVQTGAPFV